MCPSACPPVIVRAAIAKGKSSLNEKKKNSVARSLIMSACPSVTVEWLLPSEKCILSVSIDALVGPTCNSTCKSSRGRGKRGYIVENDIVSHNL